MFPLPGARGHGEDPTPSYKPSGFWNREEKPGQGLGTLGLFTMRGVSAALQAPARPRGPQRGNCAVTPCWVTPCWVGCCTRGLAGTKMCRDRHAALGPTPPRAGRACG